MSITLDKSYGVKAIYHPDEDSYRRMDWLGKKACLTPLPPKQTASSKTSSNVLQKGSTKDIGSMDSVEHYVEVDPNNLGHHNVELFACDHGHPRSPDDSNIYGIAVLRIDLSHCMPDMKLDATLKLYPTMRFKIGITWEDDEMKFVVWDPEPTHDENGAALPPMPAGYKWKTEVDY